MSPAHPRGHQLQHRAPGLLRPDVRGWALTRLGHHEKSRGRRGWQLQRRALTGPRHSYSGQGGGGGGGGVMAGKQAQEEGVGPRVVKSVGAGELLPEEEAEAQY